MRWISVVGFSTLVWLVQLFPATAQQDPSKQSAALKEIRETAADICYTVEQRGQKTETQLKVDVQAKVSGVIAKLADLGGGISGKTASDDYHGVSREALAIALQGSMECRERVFNKLIDRLLPSPPQGLQNRNSPIPASRPNIRQDTTGSCSPNMVDIHGNISITGCK